MTTAAVIAVFLLGMHVALRAVAALYRIIDLWYTIGTAYPRVIRGIVGWVATLAVVGLALPDWLRPAFLWGAGSFVPFYLSLYLIRYPLLRPRGPRTETGARP
jgi:hypothetical protein